MMNVNDLISAAVQLFNEKKYAEAIEILHQAWDGITDKNTQIPEQIKIQDRLGGCYFKQAINTKDTDKADKLFKQAARYYQERLQLTEQLEDGQTKIQEQINAQYWLGYCYFEHTQKTKDTDKADKLFERAYKYYQKQLQLTGQLEDGQDKIQTQINAQYWLGSCYLEHTQKTKDTDKADKLFERAYKYYQKQLQLTGQLEDGQDKIQQQIDAQLGLVLCYIELTKRNQNTDNFKKLACQYFSAIEGQLSQLSNEEEKKNGKKQSV